MMYVFTFSTATLYMVWLLNPFPNEYREGASLFVVRLFTDGNNPFSNESPPSFFYMYGFLGPLAISLLDRAFGDHGFFIHRLLALIWLLGAALVVEFEARRLSEGVLPRWLAFLLMLPAGWISHELISRPDNLALLLFIASSVLLARFSHWSAPVAAAVCILLSFYTKQYFVLMTIPLFIASFLICWRSAFLFGFSFTLLFFPSLYAVNEALPYYFPMALLAFGGTTMDVLHLLKQAAAFGFFYWPLLLVILLAGIRWLRLQHNGGHHGFAVAAASLLRSKGRGSAPSKPQGIAFYFCVFFVNCVLLMLLGSNTGAVMTYFYQLLLPPLIILAASTFCVDEKFRQTSLYLICIFSMFHLLGFYSFTSPLTSKEKAQWVKAESFINSHGSNVVLKSPMFVRSALKNEVEHFDCGLYAVDWLKESYNKLHLNRSPLLPFFPSAPELIQRGSEFTTARDLKLMSGACTLVVATSVSDIEALQLRQHGFQKADEIHLRTGAQVWPVEFWVHVNDFSSSLR